MHTMREMMKEGREGVVVCSVDRKYACEEFQTYGGSMNWLIPRWRVEKGDTFTSIYIYIGIHVLRHDLQ
ncbi:hypothetical protein EUGRSUZ_J00399 [Eucalyptus grandis]|uniref:Uncharacterized protein n=2 Tax=Eucalyptus grandis TaxID=71139 RepID=A0ACC3J1P8_EUCGR|nr:hypothetical protein EUGRSUZ_J00399 [Eucalyptus grandis]